MSAPVRKAVIPAAGFGTRFLPVTKSVAKEMLPIVDKPAIQYVVEEAVAAGIEDILIISARGKDSIADHFDRHIELEVFLEGKGKLAEAREVRALGELADVTVIRQGEALGLGHAVGMARNHVGHEPFVVMLGDDLMHERAGVLRGMIEAYEARDASVVAFMEVARSEISAYGCASATPIDGESRLVRLEGLVEKPPADRAPSNLAVMGRYLFTPEIFDEIAKTQPGAGGEIQLTDAITALIGYQAVYGYTFSDGRYDAGKKLDFVRATIELALERDDLGPGLRDYLRGLVGRDFETGAI
ncbi:MAG: UTP--glucose-1-phosphate uridylyltransferase GalU [Actinomycetia bacterium]|nr:UTP--glucose-1-phosphate uridylyltransferase GalU [Actinomycetes bacterium]